MNRGFVLTCLAILTTGTSAPDLRAGEAADWTLDIKPAMIVQAQEIELTVTVKIGENWHVYGRAGGADGQTPLIIKLQHSVDVVEMGDWIWPKPSTVYEGRDIEIYTGTQVFRRKLKITSATGEVKIRVTVSYQACTHELCGPPEEEELTATLTITDAKPPSEKKP